MFFWNKTTNNFHFPYGMMGLTLFDMSVIVGLKPDGKVIHMLTEPKFDMEVPLQSTTFSTSIQQHCRNIDEVFDKEHVAFLTIWLSA